MGKSVQFDCDKSGAGNNLVEQCCDSKNVDEVPDFVSQKYPADIDQIYNDVINYTDSNSNYSISDSNTSLTSEDGGSVDLDNAS